MISEIETGDVFRTAYLVSRGGVVIKAIVQGEDHVVLTVPGQILIISRTKLNLCTFPR